MIVFLTLAYCGILFLLVKLNVVKLNIFWKISPLLWMVLLFFVLFIPMQWGAPGGPVLKYQAVVSIVPNVSGEVTEVMAQPLTPMKRGDVLFEIDKRPFEYALAQARASKARAESDRELAAIEYERNRSLVRSSAAAQRDLDIWTARLAAAEAGIALATAQFDAAAFDLDNTTVRAPQDGFVVGLSLRPGRRVVSFPVSEAMTFVETDLKRLAMGVHQNAARHIRPGQSAEVTFNLYPGKIFQATVESLVPITPQGQLVVSGNVPMMPTGQDPTLPFGAILMLDEEVELPMIPGGSVGTGAIYTEAAQMTQIIRRVMIRMDMWMNYILPF
jgi:multidrug efflux pump subunit AcrA (membrane-fusion protein)